jgi:hypothetical protein
MPFATCSRFAPLSQGYYTQAQLFDLGLQNFCLAEVADDFSVVKLCFGILHLSFPSASHFPGLSLTQKPDRDSGQVTITDDQLAYIEEFCAKIRDRLNQADFVMCMPGPVRLIQ